MRPSHEGCELESNVLVFYDQAHASPRVAKNLLKSSKSQPLLRRAIDQCSQTLRSVSSGNGEHSFYSIEGVLQAVDSIEGRNAVSWTVLSCFNQLCCLVLLWEQNPGLFNSAVSSVGLCTGGIAAAASLFISSDADAVSLASKLLAVSYRLAIEAKRRSEAISPKNDSWSIAVQRISESEAQNILNDFHSKHDLPIHLHAWISAILPCSVTISGPPEILDTLFAENNALSRAKTTKLPIYAAFHSEKLNCPELGSIIGDAQFERYQKRRNSSIISPLVSEQSSLTEVLQCIIRGCFTTMLNMRDEIPRLASVDSANTCIISIGPSAPVRHVQEWISGSSDFKSSLFTPEATSTVVDQIAIVGYGGRFPEADTLQDFWEIIENAQDVHKSVPDDRFIISSQDQRSSKNRTMSSQPYGCFMKRPGAFDGTFFNMSPREALQIDPIQRILLMVTQEALEMAGYSKRTAETSRIGTFFGQATDDWRESHASQQVDIYYIGGGMRAFGPGRLNYYYKWLGPSFSIDAACSSSLAALEIATNSLHAGDCDYAVVGGGNLISALPMFSGLHKAGFTSSTGPCKTFDAAADGYCRGEGVGVVVIRRLKDAIQANDNIKGIVEGISTNHSAYAVSITHPHAATQAALMRDTLNGAGLEPDDIHYVEFHGTGTQAGDAAELSSVSQVFGLKDREIPLYVGAVKANVGHGEAAAGITSLIKALLMFEHDTIPAHAGIKSKPNAALEDDQLPGLVIPFKSSRFRTSQGPKRILINNFNATGGNTSMILRSPQRIRKEVQHSLNSYFPIVISAKTPTSLRQNLCNLKQFVDNSKSCNLADLSYSTTARRVHHQYREAFLTDSISGVLDRLEQLNQSQPTNRSPANPPITFVFSGQGNQSATIAKDLFNECDEFRRNLKEYNSLCLNLGLPSFLEFVLHSGSNDYWSPTLLQLGVVAVELALAELWKSWGLHPGLVLGHSIGEYPALVVAGVLSAADMFRLVGERARLMEQRCKPGSHGMLAVSCSALDMKHLLQNTDTKDIEIACYNCDESITLSGTIINLEKLIPRLDEVSIRFKRLEVQYAFHSAMLEPILEDYACLAKPIPFRSPKIPVASTFHATIVHEAGVFGPEYLVKQCRYPVDFTGALFASEKLEQINEHTIWIEIGPGNPICLPLIQRLRNNQDASRLVASINSQMQPWETLTKGITDCYKNGADIQWANFHRLAEHQLQMLNLPSYSFDLKDYWIPLEGNKQLLQPEKRVRLSPLLHYLDQFIQNEDDISASFRSELSDPDLFNAIQGHEVLGVPLCPSSVYAAIALEAVSYMQKESENSSEKAQEYEIFSTDIHRPLVVQRHKESTLSVKACYNADTKTFRVEFITKRNMEAIIHATTSIRNSLREDWRKEWSRVDFLARTRLETLESQSDRSNLVLQRPILYKLFAEIVNYSSAYQGIQSMVLSKETKEAVADIAFPVLQHSETHIDWHLMDALIHTAGFILNNGIDGSKYSFISDGWDSLQVLRNIRRSSAHKCYARLEPLVNEKLFSGNVYLFADNELVASCTGLRFHRMGSESLRKFLAQQMNSSVNEQRVRSGDSNTQNVAKIDRTYGPKMITQTDGADVIQTILSEESGVTADQIEDKLTLQDLGLDSILITEITERITAEIGVQISSREVLSAESVGRLKELISVKTTIKPNPVKSDTRIDTTRQNPNPSPSPPQSKLTNTEPAQENGHINEQDLGDLFQSTIVKETGATVEQVEDCSDLNEVGVDSLLAVEILDLIQKKTGKNWSHSFFKDNPNIKSIRAAVAQGRTGDLEVSNQPNQREKNSGGTPNSDLNTHRNDSNGLVEGASNKECKSVLLQGEPQSEKTPLILLPPGLGAVAVYTKLPKHPSEIPIYGLTSPFLHDPTSLSFTIDNAVKLYIRAIEKIYPSGIIHLGGWSLGGLLAYEVAKSLTETGRQVGALLIIDCPFPDPWPSVSPILTGDALTVMGHDKLMMERYGNNPPKLKKHVATMMNAFKCFSTTPMRFPERVAHACVIQATRGSQIKYMKRTLAAQEIVNELGYASETASEILEKRHPELRDYQDEKKISPECPDRWDTLIGDDLIVKVVDADHISLVTESQPVSQLSEYVYEAVDQAIFKLDLKG